MSSGLLPVKSTGMAASLQTAMTHIAMQEVQDGKVVDWMEKVSDGQFGASS